MAESQQAAAIRARWARATPEQRQAESRRLNEAKQMHARTRRINALIADAPKLTPEQLAKLRVLLDTASAPPVRHDPAAPFVPAPPPVITPEQQAKYDRDFEAGVAARKRDDEARVAAIKQRFHETFEAAVDAEIRRREAGA